MKLIGELNIILFVIITIMSCNKENKKLENSVITFENELYDFGEIPSNKNVTAVFKYSNIGNEPLLIHEIKTSCGCTVPEWEKKVIHPNEVGEIKIIYDAKHVGRFRRGITVFYNGDDSPKKIIIKGEVDYLHLFE